MSLKKEMLEKPIDCPRCWVETDRTKRRGVIIDVCAKCEGIWLDTNELKKLISAKALEVHLTKYAEKKATSKLVCPRCGGLMDLEYADKVEVDVCLSCKGIWLDKGELTDLEKKKNRDYSKVDSGREVEQKYDKLQDKHRDQSTFGKIRRLLF